MTESEDNKKDMNQNGNKITIKSLFANYHGNYKPKEFSFGESKGKEIW